MPAIHVTEILKAWGPKKPQLQSSKCCNALLLVLTTRRKKPSLQNGKERFCTNMVKRINYRIFIFENSNLLPAKSKPK